MTFRRNPQFAEQLRRQPGVQRAIRHGAEASKAKAEAIAPRGESGDTARRFVVVEEDGQVRLGNTDPFFHLTEFGSANNPPYAPLRRGARAAGLRFEDTGK